MAKIYFLYYGAQNIMQFRSTFSYNTNAEIILTLVQDGKDGSLSISMYGMDSK